jgi:hypothetical protein
MTNTTIVIPDFDFTAFYYQQILEALVRYKRQYLPELTDESEFEPAMQLLKAFACVGHLNSVNIDLIANESTLPTAQLVETVRNMLRLIDYELSPATPAQVELLYKLSKTITATTVLVPENARASIQRSGDSPIITFEANEELSSVQTDVVSALLSVEDDSYTVNTLPFTPWLTPAVGDMFYVGHSDVMWDKIDFTFSTAASGITGVWEFYEENWLKTNPDSVVSAGSELTVVINELLGTSPVPGTTVRVTLNESGAYEEATSEWDGSDNFVTVGLLGQTSPSTTATDYSIGSDWTIFDDVEDDTNNLQDDESVSYGIPQTTDKNWIKATVNGTEAYWVRFRITVIVGPSSPEISGAVIDSGGLYVVNLATQGITVEDDPLGSSTGLADQRFETSRDYFIKNSQTLTVDDVEWTEVDDFLDSLPADTHYKVELGEDDRATIVFGSGTNGKIPPIGVNNIALTEYRYNAQDDGNVGPATVTVDKQGLTNISTITNPRQASGWKEADGSSTASLELAKQQGPASLRAKDVAIGPDDVITLTKEYEDDNGAKLFSRAMAVEEGLGPKTVELIVVVQGGELATTEQLEDLAEYFNGDKYAVPALPQRIVLNQEVTAFNFSPYYLDITATVTTNATAQEIINHLNQIFHPEAMKSDGITYEWEFGCEIPTSRILHEIYEADESTTKVVLTEPASDITLEPRQLPQISTIAITVVAL